MRIILLFAIAHCLLTGGVHGQEPQKKILHVYTWEDYFSPEAIRLFEEKTGAVVDFEYYDSNETLLTKVGGGGYDIITPAGYLVEGLFQDGLLRKIDHALLPNFKFVHSELLRITQEDQSMTHSIPYTVTVSGVGYNPDLVPDDAVGSWDIFADARLADRLTLMNDPREVLGAALKSRGFSLNTTSPHELDEAERLLRTWKKNIALFSVDEASDGLRDGKYAAIQTYYGEVVELLGENPNLRFFVPREGSAFDADHFAICSDSENVELAHAFINHFLDPEIAALNMEMIGYLMPNNGLDLKNHPKYSVHPILAMPPEIREKCEMIRYIPPAIVDLYYQKWENILIGD